LIQRNAMRAWETGTDFQDLLREDAEVREHLGDEELARCFDREHHLRHVDRIFERAFAPDDEAGE
jgi:adenylosuccinate lyase